MMSTMRVGWMVVLLVACGPSVATQDGDGGADSSSTSDSAMSTSTTATSSTGIVDESGSATSTDDTGAMPGRCFATYPIDVVPSYLHGVARLRSDAPLQLLFGSTSDEPEQIRIVGAASPSGPWTTVQTIDDHRLDEIADIDGDGLDDVTMDVNDGSWWSADPTGMLAMRGPIDVDGDATTLVRLPGEARAARVDAGEELEVALGSGDGTFGPSTITPSLEPGYSPGPAVVALAEGMITAGRFEIDCFDFCQRGDWVVELQSNGVATVRANLDDERVVGLGDLEPDGALDLFVERESTLFVRRGPAFGEGESLGSATGHRIGDFDGDGATDVLVVDGDFVGVYWNDGGVLGGVATPIPLPGTPSHPLGPPVDLDGDGAAEVVMSSFDSLLVVRSVACE